MTRRAHGQLKGLFALAGTLAGVLVLAGCGRPADAVPMSSAPATAVVSGAGAPTTAAAPATSAASPTALEVTSATAPLAVRVVGIRQDSGDRIRVELTLTNVATADGWRPGSPAQAAVQAAVGALDGLSLLSADGRRRMFALHDSSGQRVGTPAAAPAPGHPVTFWTSFPAADGPVSLLLPGFAPLSPLPVAARSGPSEP